MGQPEDSMPVYVPDDVELDATELERVLMIVADHLGLSSPLVVARAAAPAAGRT